jgi:hypothetical protein
VRNELVGLEYLIDPIFQETMKDMYPAEYVEALSISILTIHKHELQNLLIKNEIIFDD